MLEEIIKENNNNISHSVHFKYPFSFPHIVCCKQYDGTHTHNRASLTINIFVE